MMIPNGEDVRIKIAEFEDRFGSDVKEGSFNILVELPDGQIFESVSQKILPVPVGATIRLKYIQRKVLNTIKNIVDQGFVKVAVDAPLINENAELVSLKWDITGDFEFRENCDDLNYNPHICYIHESNPVGPVNIINAKKINGDHVVAYELGETLANYKFSSRYYFTVVQKAISDDAANYWEEVGSSLARDGTIYDLPAGLIRSNISQTAGDVRQVIGYFYTASIDTLRHRVTKEETGFQRSPCTFFSQAEGCCGCFSLAGSSYDKPDFWNE
ncbi:MAG: hypothetical protein IPL46_30930 [Saprospiraceae bacterium]|nr:hypothetical protein [Saprospiraceae bacterium]